ncbi:MAG: Crp/Fnr family transcriptional regulator [Bacteroidetes bacterium]|nr:Crp/Fnr family transcriptional regulator [Bacteroidota bacterium]
MKLPLEFKEIFEPALLAEMELLTTVHEAKSGDIVVEIDQTVSDIPVLISGTMNVVRIDPSGREILLYYIHAKESCAMSFTCCMQGERSEIRATAETDIEYLSIPISAMDVWLSKYPSWKSFVMRTIRGRFNELLNAIDQLAFQKLDERLVHYLREKSRATNSSLINLSHEEIATDMASSREVISRLLKRLENDKKLLLYRNQIKLLKDF